MSADDPCDSSTDALSSVAEAARELGVPVGTVKRWVRQGCPHVPGHRGRGHATLVNVQDVRQWHEAASGDAVLLRLAAELPHVLAGATAEAWRLSEGIDKRRLAGLSAAFWYVCATAVLDHLRERCPALPELAHIPEQIEALQKIARQ